MQYRSGAELFVRDLALTLHRRGHSVAIYAPIIGDLADELRARCVSCVAELSLIGQPPELIIGNTRDETVACLAQFPGVPAISVCHDRTAAHGRPPRFARIRQHVAVDENCAERLCLEHGISRDELRVIFNGVDLERFRPRAPLPPRPRRAAIFSNYATEGAETRAVREACEALGIELELIGKGVERQATAPEAVLGRFDLVFAKARCAMEAMAVGCAVVVLNEGTGLAGLVTPARVGAWHGWNFGRRLMQAPIECQALIAEIQAYDAASANEVSTYVREHLSLQAMTDAMEQLARQVLREEARRAPVAPQDEWREFARHTTDNLMPFGVVPVAVQTGIMLAQLEAQAAAALAAAPSAPPALACSEASAAIQAAQATLIHDLEQQLRATRASLSWRLTAPLRWLGRVLRTPR